MSSLPIEKLYLNGDKPDTIKMPTDTSSLEKLYVTSLDKIIGSISELLPNLSNLTTLSISCNIQTEDSDGARVVAAFIANSQLLKLELLNCAATVSIINSAKESSVRTLKFHRANFRNEGVTALVNILTKHSSSLSKLSFTKCGFGRNALFIILNAIKGSKLKTLILDCPYFDTCEIVVIADCVANSGLIKLSLCGTIYLTKGHNMAHVRNIMFDAIKCSALKTLDVRGCPTLANFSIINYLILHQGLTKFKFCEYKFSMEKRCALLNSIQENCSLEHILFDSTYIYSDAGLVNQLITRMCALIKNPRFKSFDLNYNSLFDEELRRIMDAIKESTILSLKFSEQNSKNVNMIVVGDLLESYHFEQLKLHFFVRYSDEHIKQILTSVQRSSITKFGVSCDFKYTCDELRNTIEPVLQIQRRRAQGRHTKSAQSVQSTQL